MSLLGISRVIAEAALELGGSYIAWEKAQLCGNLRPSGEPCFSEDSGSSWVDCPVCHGSGVVYSKPQVFKAIYTDNSNRFEYDENGGLVAGKKTLSIPHNIPVSVLKQRYGSTEANTARRVARDRFRILSPEGQVVETVWLESDAVDPFISSGRIYRIVEVSNNY